MVDAGPFARIAISVPLKQLFDYHVPDGLADRVVPGMRVRVSFHNRRCVGYCIERVATAQVEEVLDIEDALDDEPILDEHLLDLVGWTAGYYHASLGEVIEAAVPKGVRHATRRMARWARLVDGVEVTDDKRGDHEARQRVMDALADADEQALPVTALRKTANTGESCIQTLAKRGLIEVFEAPAPQEEPGEPAALHEPSTAPILTDEQRNAVTAVRGSIAGSRYETFLLYGVTGSGKTEVYLQAIETVLERGGGALVLVPEIALTPQTVARFRERLGQVAVLHSLLPETERAAAHRELRSGRVRVAIGARSAVFAPISSLGIIVVDECHESTYKQDSTPRYHARDVAVKRAALLGIPCLLGSATPSMESFENAAVGRYTRLRLPHRVTGHPLATIEVVDRRQEQPDRRGATTLLSDRLVTLLGDTVSRGEQAILFLNRRGFARRIHCTLCGFAMRCGSCDIGLTYHKDVNRSMCHYCGTVRLVPSRCPDCSADGIRRSMPGTERIEEVLARLFPQAPVDRLDRDTASNRDRMVDILDRFRRGETQILVGTQMVAKGHDIPGVTLVGIIDADIALGLPDFRAAERTAQLICQVAGRAGRGKRPGRVVIQTREPDHYAIEAGQRQDLEHLFAAEKASRKMLGYPPYGYLVRCVCEDTDEQVAEESATLVGKALREAAANTCGEVRILGPAPAPLTRLRTWYRYHILLKGSSRKALREVADTVAWKGPQKHTTRLVVDVDPQNLM